jgi:lipopolysaccharide/colanic/teichoic acid biosynthesis glycosyltransferase
MRIAITGASGFLGKQLVLLLKGHATSLLLVGRDIVSLRAAFPNAEVSRYEDLAASAVGCDALVHLAVLNNDSNSPWEQFRQVNVTLAVETCLKARDAGVRKFIFLSSTHALDPSNNSPYARSKRQAVDELDKIVGIDLVVLYIPTVVGEQLAGKLTRLNRLPPLFKRWALAIVSALTPTVNAEIVARSVVEHAGNQTRNNRVILSNDPDGNRVYRAAKRALDLAVATGILVLLGWAMAIIWAVVRLQRSGPGIFKQVRIGENEKAFICYKFRTMVLSAPSAGTHQVSHSFVTPVGKFLRRTKLDELPQIFNIFRNEMSLVGPRPCLPSQTEVIVARRAVGAFAVKPGITGLAQVNGIDMSRPGILAQWDERYLRLRTLILDIRIIVRTVFRPGTGDRTDSD